MLIDLFNEFVVELAFVLAKKAYNSSRPIHFKMLLRKLRPFRRKRLIGKVQFVNREREFRAIKDALEDEFQLRTIYFYGPGGVGKTRLLEEVKDLRKSCKNKSALSWGGIIDLYYEDLHSISAIQDMIVDRLDPRNEHFQDYRQARQDRKTRISQGQPSAPFEHQKIDELFITGFSEYSKKYRPVLAFDTLENLSYESDVIQNICQIEDISVLAREWLLKRVSELSNSVILFAGREEPSFKDALKKTYRNNPEKLETIRLDGLIGPDFKNMLSFLLKEKRGASKFLKEHVPRLHSLTNGLPVQLTLAVELINQLDQFKEFVSQEITDPDEWGKQFVNVLFNDQENDSRLFFLLALVRKGLTVELLHHLVPEWTKEACEQRLSEVKRLGIVKVRDMGNEVFLHDVLYELFDKYSPPKNKLDQWYRRIVDYYREKVELIDNDRIERNQTKVKLLYYELLLNPKRTFEEKYMLWSEEAIRGNEVGLDMQLRNELFRFISSHIPYGNPDSFRLFVDQDSAIRWMKRSLMNGAFHKATNIAETILDLGPDSYEAFIAQSNFRRTDILSEGLYEEAKTLFQKAAPLFWARLLSLYGYALTYLGEDEVSTNRVFEQGYTLLIKSSIPTTSAMNWLRNLSLGQLLDYQGYMLRNFGHYGQAINYYERALESYEAIEFKEELAYTLNNLAFALALLGKTKEAQKYVEEGFSIRRRLGQKYPRALSYNTRGLIYCMEGQTEDGQKDCYRALNMFEEMNSTRGIGLATNALGYILRQKGKIEAQHSRPEQAESSFVQAEEFLQQSGDIFEQLVDEPIRLWEAFNERGSLFYDWGNLHLHLNDRSSAAVKFKRAEEYHGKALTVAREHNLHFQEADTLDDLAYALMASGKLQEANKRLQECFKLVPNQYQIQVGKGFQIDSEFGEAYWLILGKVHWQQARWILRSLDGRDGIANQNEVTNYEAAVEHLVLAFSYLHRFSTESRALKQRQEQLLSVLDKSGLTTSRVESLARNTEQKYQISAESFFKSAKLM